jgi:transcriptional regulator with PAS, ATPase and Fis domain
MASIPEPVLIGESDAIRRIDEQASVIARTDAKVLVLGESGVGKDVVARVIHYRSARRAHPFTVINCAGVPETLLESELFGHVRGSFTGADRDRAGLLETGNGGTLFLDEIGEMSLRMQALLLRFLETGEIQRVGADRRQTRIDVRVIAATNRNLSARIAEGQFRADLYYRLSVVNVHVPPLRERPEDVPALLEHFLALYAAKERVPAPQLAPDAVAALRRFTWPGNVRELRNLAERLTVRAVDRPTVTVADLPKDIGGGLAAPAGGGGADAQRERAAALLQGMLQQGQSFWTVVHRPFMARDLTRADVGAVVAEGLELTNGSYKQLVKLFNIPPDDYKPFLSFLRKHECHVPFQQYRKRGPRAAGDDLRGRIGGLLGISALTSALTDLHAMCGFLA